MDKSRPKRKYQYKKGKLVLSFSAYKLYKDCPAAFFNRYIARTKIPDQDDKTATVPGSIIDRLNRIYFKKLQETGRKADWIYDSTRPHLREHFEFWINDPKVFLGDGQFAKDKESAFLYVAKVAEKMLRLIQSEKLAENFNFILSEWEHNNPTEFGSPYKPLVINEWLSLMGSFDFYGAETRDGLGKLLDWKASRSFYHLDPDQLKLYNIAVIKKWNLRVGMCGFVLPILGTTKWHRFNNDVLEGFTGTLVHTAKKIDREEFDYTPSEASCRMCPFKSSCAKAVVKTSTDIKKRAAAKNDVVNANIPTPLLEEPEL